MPDDRSIAESTSTWGVVNVESSGGVDPTEELRVPSSKQPWAICKYTVLTRISQLIDVLASLREWWVDHQLYRFVSRAI